MAGRSENIWIPWRLIKSKAFLALGTANAHKILAIFWTKRQMVEMGRKGKEQWNITNNGEIVFTFEEAREKLGISDGTFRNGIDELRDKGFINIASTGMGIHKVTNLYSISNRWKLYDTQEYEPPKPRPKGPINRGFQMGNQLGRNCKKRKS
jgi:hypothetical protein